MKSDIKKEGELQRRRTIQVCNNKRSTKGDGAPYEYMLYNSGCLASKELRIIFT